MTSGVYEHKLHSAETRKKIGKANKGRLPWCTGKHLSEKHKKKISKSKMGQVSWRKGKKFGQLSEEIKQKISRAKIGKHLSKKTRRKMSEAQRGEKCYLWKGGVTTENKRIRKGVENRLWREAVFARDNYTCQKTGVRGGRIRSHHIRNFAQWPELRFAIDNGITLSEKAHKEFHRIYGIKNNNDKQIKKFINSGEKNGKIS